MISLASKLLLSLLPLPLSSLELDTLMYYLEKQIHEA